MGGARAESSRWTDVRVLARRAVVGAFALAAGACGTVQNMMPDPRDFHLPEAKNYAPTAVSSYARPVMPQEPVGPGDLVDGQGLCAGVAPAGVSSDGPAPGGATNGSVALEMTECQVARALGPPQQSEVGGRPAGGRTVLLTYVGGERAGIYRFVNGRLTSIERGPEPPAPPPVAKKPPPKKPKPPPPPA